MRNAFGEIEFCEALKEYEESAFTVETRNDCVHFIVTDFGWVVGFFVAVVHGAMVFVRFGWMRGLPRLAFFVRVIGRIRL